VCCRSVARESHPEDGRAWSLRLTTRGKKLARSVDESSTRHFDHLARRLGDSVSEVLTALDRLSHVMVLTEEDE
jgi:DNA-binding MarR family transcriptional regulator